MGGAVHRRLGLRQSRRRLVEVESRERGTARVDPRGSGRARQPTTYRVEQWRSLLPEARRRPRARHVGVAGLQAPSGQEHKDFPGRRDDGDARAGRPLAHSEGAHDSAGDGIARTSPAGGPCACVRSSSGTSRGSTGAAHSGPPGRVRRSPRSSSEAPRSGYRVRLTEEQCRGRTTSSGASLFLTLTVPAAMGVPDEARPVIVVTTIDGTTAEAAKWVGDSTPTSTPLPPSEIARPARGELLFEARTPTSGTRGFERR